MAMRRQQGGANMTCAGLADTAGNSDALGRGAEPGCNGHLPESAERVINLHRWNRGINRMIHEGGTGPGFGGLFDMAVTIMIGAFEGDEQVPPARLTGCRWKSLPPASLHRPGERPGWP